MEVDIDRTGRGTAIKFSYKNRHFNVLVADAKDRYYGMVPMECWRQNTNDLGATYRQFDEILLGDYLPGVVPGSTVKSDLEGFVVPDVITTAVILACIDDINGLDPTAGEYEERCPDSHDGLRVITIPTSTPSSKKNYFFMFYNGVRYCYDDRSSNGLIMPVKFL